MVGFVRSRIHVGAWAVFIILIILLLQNSLSWNLLVGKFIPPDSRLFFGEEISNQIWTIVKLVILVPTIAFLILDWRRLLRISIVLDNLLLTFELLVSILLLVLTLGTDTPARAYLLMRDTLLIMVINILIFSLWYWILDSPVLRQGTLYEFEPWDFLFPQRSSNIPSYDKWSPAYPDYLFIAFTTTFAFGPTDTLPLSQRAKALMLLQAAISVITIVVLAGRALSILPGSLKFSF
ncbi:MAG: hypothetical protein MUO26_15650 [Methanotrichaceae archaeon]|nr:hypothetical protein [Methanotrichaceae archaeon]